MKPRHRKMIAWPIIAYITLNTIACLIDLPHWKAGLSGLFFGFVVWPTLAVALYRWSSGASFTWFAPWQSAFWRRAE